MTTKPTPRRVAVIQARMSSTRLPGKVLKPLLGLPAIVFMVQRVRQSKRLDEVVVATSHDRSDDELARCLDEAGIRCHRGSLDDVLDRYYQAALASGADHVVRLTGDCPLMDADLVDEALERLAAGGVAYVSNVDPPTYPDGLDVEAFTFEALQRAWREATLPVEREHVTPYLRTRKDLFPAECWRGLSDLSALRWTVDHPDDLDHVRSLIERLAPSSPTSFDRFDLYRVCERGHSLAAQPQHRRNEGMDKHLLQQPQGERDGRAED